MKDVQVFAFAAPVGHAAGGGQAPGGTSRGQVARGAGVRADEAVSPASVAKIQVGLTAAQAIATGDLDGHAVRTLRPGPQRTPGPVGISLLRDEVRMTIRDLITQMLTVSDNVATDELIGLVGLDRINALTASLGLSRTRMDSDLRTMLDRMAREAGFDGYAQQAAHDPATGPPTLLELRRRLHESAALDPHRGWCTTPAETVRLLQAIWSGTAAHPTASATVREAMAQQLTRHRIATGFGPDVAVAAKSGGLMGLLRNEAGVVTLGDGRQFAVAVFTRCTPATVTEPARIDAEIGRVARGLVDRLAY